MLSRRASNALVRASAALICLASASLPSMPSAPRGPLAFSVRAWTLARLVASAASEADSWARFCNSSRADATRRGSSAAVSPISTLRSAPSGSGGSLGTPV